MIAEKDEVRVAATQALTFLKKLTKATGKAVGQTLDRVEVETKKICEARGMSAADADKVAKGVKVVTAVTGAAIGCAVAAPAVIAAVGGSAGAGAVAVTHGLATIGGGSVAVGGAGMAGGLAVTAGASAIAGGAAGVATIKRDDKKDKENEKLQ